MGHRVGSVLMIDDPIPKHLALPFRFVSASGTGSSSHAPAGDLDLSEKVVCTVTQDSDVDVRTSVEIILRVREGSIYAVPELGSPDLTFRDQPLDLSDIVLLAASQDSRISLSFAQDDNLDGLIAQVRALVTGGKESG